jgi:hypothetical protein
MRTENMRRFALVFGLAASILMSGCSPASEQLVGTWKGDIAPVTGAKDSIADAFKKLLNVWVGPLTLEFNRDGKYKVSVLNGSETGTYSVSGNEVTLTPDDKEPSKSRISMGKLVLSSDGKTLRTRKEFESDSVLELKKQESGTQVN